MGFSIPYDSSNYTEDENRILRTMMMHTILNYHIYISKKIISSM